MIWNEFESINKWFEAKRLSLNFGKTHFMQFTTKNSLQIDPYITCANKLISDAYDTKFLWIYEDSKLSWETHTEQITHKLSAAC
jgi:hypothetical protein